MRLTQQTSVFLLSLVPYRGSNWIAHFLSREHGNLPAHLRHVREIKSKRHFGFNPGDLLTIEYSLSENSKFIQLKEFSLSKAIRHEHFSYQRFLFHNYLLEVINRITVNSQECKVPYDVLNGNLELSTEDASLENRFLLWGIVQLLQFSGIWIQYDQCERCRQPSWQIKDRHEPAFRKMDYYLQFEEGTFLCENCVGKTNRKDFRFSSPMVKILWLLDPIDQADQLASTIPDPFLFRCICILSEFLEFRFNIKLNSYKILKKHLERDTN